MSGTRSLSKHHATVHAKPVQRITRDEIVFLTCMTELCDVFCELADMELRLDDQIPDKKLSLSPFPFKVFLDVDK